MKRLIIDPTKSIIFLTLITLLGACQSPTESEDDARQDQPVSHSSTEDNRWLELAGRTSQSKKVVLVSGDEEYRSEEVLPQMAKMLSNYHGLHCVVLFAQDPTNPGIVDPNYTGNIPGLHHLEDADLMILFTRFRNLPDTQMIHIERYVLAGHPIVALRTATHAFMYKDENHNYAHWSNAYRGPKQEWVDGFGRLVLGEKWHTHHGHHKHQSTRGILVEGVDHPILTGLTSGAIWGSTDVYGVRLPLPGDTQPLVLGQVVNRAGQFSADDIWYGMLPEDTEVAEINPARKDAGNPNDPMMPIAWIKSYQLPDGNQGQAFVSTIGSSSDYLNEGVRRLLMNASLFLLGETVRAEDTVDLVGNYQPSQYSFQDDAYWDLKNIRIADLY